MPTLYIERLPRAQSELVTFCVEKGNKFDCAVAGSLEIWEILIATGRWLKARISIMPAMTKLTRLNKNLWANDQSLAVNKYNGSLLWALNKILPTLSRDNSILV
jgi:hypothetical protein